MVQIGIVGYGNLGKGVEQACRRHADMNLQAVFTRRDPSGIAPEPFNGRTVPVVPVAGAAEWRDRIDVMILCGGSATDLPGQGPRFASLFNTVDSFDTHARIPEYFAQVDAAARQAGRLSLISCGWDPGLFSVARVLFSGILPEGRDFTFWGRGVSQGHSDAIRRIPGVLDARQYTQPVEKAVEAARSDRPPELSTREKHLRECYVAVAEGADREAIRQAIVTMPNYFADYDTTVTFLPFDELREKHGALPHGGFVIRNGKTSEQARHVAEFSLRLDSNPEFTGSVLTAYARAVHRMSLEGRTGAITVLDVAPGLLSAMDADALRASML
ncbi:MAG: diaminopimelate dehydrogenase [Clostridia bacterium]|nr:diaminopimelate dehydrogenase [Clostridia bacterium]